MEIPFECTAGDYADAQIAHSRTQAIYYAFLTLGLMALVIGITMFPKMGLAVSLPEFVLGAVFLLWPLVFLPVHAKRDFKKHPHMAGPKLLRVGDEGFGLESDNSSSKSNWSLITRFRETPHVFMLYVGARNFMIVPKRAFSSTELDQFCALVRQKVPGKYL